MPDLGLNGPYALTTSKINEVVTRTSPGAYVLGKTNEGTFYISYVGRADKDINARLKEHVGNYSQFEYDYFFSPQAAFAKECNLWHDFEPSDKILHPNRPNGSEWKCPRCGRFG